MSRRLVPKTSSKAAPRSGRATPADGPTGPARPIRPAKGSTQRSLADLLHPELLNDTPRKNLTRTKLRYTICAVIFVGLLLLGVMSTDPTWIPGFAGLVMGGSYALLTWTDSRSMLVTDGDVIRARWVFRTYEMRGRDVSRVVYLFNGKYPDFRLIAKDGTRFQVPTSRVRGGHPVFFAWLVVHAPDAIWDKRSVLFLRSIDEKGLL
jgi:hypothetical protein